MYVTKTSVLVGSDSCHTTIAKEHSIRDALPGREVVAVPIEIYPNDGDFRRPPKEWRLHTDLPKEDWPEWYSESAAEIACQERVQSVLNTRKSFDFSSNESVTHLPYKLPACTHLYCNHNQLTGLPELPACTWLHCPGNQLTELPELPACTHLYCDNNQLTKLPELPVCAELYCNNNQLTELPELPACTWLHCNNNQLTELPELPICTWLSCGNNQLTGLPELPACTWLHCPGNQLTDLPELPACTELSCKNNQHSMRG